MRRMALVVSVLLLAAGCTDSDTTLEAVADEPTTTVATTALETTAVEAVEDSMDDGEGDLTESSTFICPDGNEVAFDLYELGRPVGLEIVPLDNGTEIRSSGGWVEIQGAFVDAEPLLFEERIALRLLDPATGEEQACPRAGDAEILNGEAGPAQISSCAVSPPWGVMGGQQVTYEGVRGQSGTVQILRNDSPLTSLLVGLTWDDLLTIRQASLLDELPEAFVEPFGEPGEIFFSDFGSPPGEMAYSMIVRDSEGTDLQRVDCGSVIVPSLESVTCSMDLVDGYPRITVSGGAFPREVRRDGQAVDLTMSIDGLIDTAAVPGVTHQYEVTVSGLVPDAPSQVVPCGSIVAETIDLKQRLESAAAQIRAPHWYGEVTPLCVDCSEGPLYLGWNGSTVYLWADDVFTRVEAISPLWYTSPADVPQLLLDAIDDGLDVQAEFDGFDLKKWTIDGEGASYRCLDADTAPVDIRQPYQETILSSCTDPVSG